MPSTQQHNHNKGIYLRTRSGDRLINLARLRANKKLRKVLIRGMLFGAFQVLRNAVGGGRVSDLPGKSVKKMYD